MVLDPLLTLSAPFPPVKVSERVRSALEQPKLYWPLRWSGWASPFAANKATTEVIAKPNEKSIFFVTKGVLRKKRCKFPFVFVL